MQKHRKRKQYKKISIAAVTLGIVGIPTAAIACWDTQETGTTRASERQSAPASPSAPSPVASIQNQAAPVATPTGTPEPTGQPTQDPQTAQPSTAATQPPRETQSAKPAPGPGPAEASGHLEAPEPPDRRALRPCRRGGGPREQGARQGRVLGPHRQ